MAFLKLEPGRNYAYIFIAITCLTLLFYFIFGEKIGGVFFFITFYYLGAIQLRSGLFFNKSWTAQYRRKNQGVPISVILSFIFGTVGLIMVLFQR